MRILSLMAIVSLGVGIPAVAKDPPPNEDKIICKRQQDADTGSHFATTKKVCRTKSEWKEMENGAENTLRKIREQGGACPTCLSTGSGGGPG